MNIRLALASLMVLPGLCAAQGFRTMHAPLPAQSAKPDWNWANDSARISRSPQLAASKAVCARLRGQEPPATDWPDATTTAALVDCDAVTLYYGIGQVPAPVRARQCALLETQRPGSNDTPFSGTAMLMTIYANGVGAARNLELATSLACRIDGAAFEVDGRVKHLQQLLAEHWRGHDFSYCDDIASGMAEGVCAAHNGSIADVKRSDELDSMSQRWTAAERTRFEQLLSAMRTYAQASGENEVDLSGSGRAAFEIEQEHQVKDTFMQLLDTLQTSSLPAASATDYQSADARLNDVYRQIMAIQTEADERINAGNVTKSGIRRSQRAWLRYRDAWTAFAAAKYPHVSATSVQAELTRQRTKDLQDHVPEPGTAESSPQRADTVAITFHPLPATAAHVLEQARGIVTGGNADATPMFQVIFDPNAPSDAALWRNLQRLHPDLVIRWLPIAYFGKDSAAIAATMLDAADPAAALAANFAGYDSNARHGGLRSVPGKTLGAGQAALSAAWAQWGGYTPMLVVVDAHGHWQQTGGANPEVIDAVLRVRQADGPPVAAPQK